MAVHLCTRGNNLTWEKLKPYILGRHRSQDDFNCGACNKTFPSICTLHLHCIKHNGGGSYFFDSVTNTAYPKYDTYCRSTQVEEHDHDPDIFLNESSMVRKCCPREINLVIDGTDFQPSVTDELGIDFIYSKTSELPKPPANTEPSVLVNVRNLLKTHDGSITFEMDEKDSHLFDSTANAIMEQMKLNGSHWLSNVCQHFSIKVVPCPMLADGNTQGNDDNADDGRTVTEADGESIREVAEDVMNNSSPVKQKPTDDSPDEADMKYHAPVDVSVPDQLVLIQTNKPAEDLFSSTGLDDTEMRDEDDATAGCNASDKETQIEEESSVTDDTTDKNELLDNRPDELKQEFLSLHELSDTSQKWEGSSVASTPNKRKRSPETVLNVETENQHCNKEIESSVIESTVRNSRPVRARRLTSKFKESDINIFNSEREGNSMSRREKFKRTCKENKLKHKDTKEEATAVRKRNSDVDKHKETFDSKGVVKGRRGDTPRKTQTVEAQMRASEALLSLCTTSTAQPTQDTELTQDNDEKDATRSSANLKPVTDLPLELFAEENTEDRAVYENRSANTGQDPGYSDIATDRETGDESSESEKTMQKNTRCKSRSKKRGKRKSIPLAQRKDLACDTCGKIGTAAMVRYHKKVHAGKLNYSCDQCGKGFTTKPALRSHMLHHGEKQWKCNLCPQSFFRRNYLETHLKKHSGENAYIFVCDICGEGFKEKYILRRHINNSHKKIRNFECDICKEKFFRADTRDNHRARHFDACWKCSYCAKMFKSEADRRRHELTHTGEKPFFCSLCSTRFSQLFPYYKHMLNAHGIHHDQAKELRMVNTELGHMHSKKQPDVQGTEHGDNPSKTRTDGVIVKKHLRKCTKRPQSDGLEMTAESALFTEVDEVEIQQAVDESGSIVGYTSESTDLASAIVLNMRQSGECSGETVVIQADDVDADGRYIMYNDGNQGDPSIVILPDYASGNMGYSVQVSDCTDIT